MQTVEQVRELMFTKIREWQSSGLSQKAFCETGGIRYHIFHYWYKKFRCSGTNLPAERFIPINIARGSGDVFATMQLANGNKLVFHQPVSADYLRSLL